MFKKLKNKIKNISFRFIIIALIIIGTVGILFFLQQVEYYNIYPEKTNPGYNSFVNAFDKLSVIFGLITTILLFLGWVKNGHSNDFIEIIIKLDEKKFNKIKDEKIKTKFYKVEKWNAHKTGLLIQRKHFTRSEIQGVLNNINSLTRYDIEYMSSIEFYEQFKEVQNKKNKKEFDLYISENDNFEFIPLKSNKEDYKSVNSQIDKIVTDIKKIDLGNKDFIEDKIIDDIKKEVIDKIKKEYKEDLENNFPNISDKVTNKIKEEINNSKNNTNKAK